MNRWAIRRQDYNGAFNTGTDHTAVNIEFLAWILFIIQNENYVNTVNRHLVCITCVSFTRKSADILHPTSPSLSHFQDMHDKLRTIVSCFAQDWCKVAIRDIQLTYRSHAYESGPAQQGRTTMNLSKMRELRKRSPDKASDSKLWYTMKSDSEIC